MPGVTCAKCGASLSGPGVECPHCHALRRAKPAADEAATLAPPPGRPAEEDAATLAPPKEAVVAFESLSAALQKGAPTIQEPPPSDLRPGVPSTAGGSSGPADPASGMAKTITEPPAAGAANDGHDTDAPTIKTPEFGLSPSARTSAEPPSGAAEEKGSSGAGVLPSNRSSSKSSAGPAGRSSFLHSGVKTKADGSGELFDDGKYEILKEIARGGMGAVYKARQRDLNRIVALKVMLSGAMASEGEKKRFLREAEASAKLKHPNIVPVYDIGEVDGNLYFTMDFVEGSPLSEKKKDLDRAALLDVMIKVCDAVAFAHMRGIIHRDLKPANVMMDKRGEPLIMDFGLAKETTTEGDSGAPDLRTREGSVMGTPHYMPPEQAEGTVSEIDVRSDVYSLGVILYELWTGKLPFLAKRMSDLLLMVIEKEPPSPRSIDPTVPWEIEAIALRAMEKQKAKRYETALDMKRDLERFKSGEAILARQASTIYRARKWVRRNRVPLAGSLAALVGAAGLGVLYHREMNRQWYAALDEGTKKIAAAGDVLAVTSKTADTVPAKIEEARKVADPDQRNAALEALGANIKGTTDTVATARGSLALSRDVEKELHEGVQREEKRASDIANYLGKQQDEIVRAVAEAEREKKARVLKAQAEALLASGKFPEARSNATAAIALSESVKKDVDELIDKIQAAERAAESKDREEFAAKQLDEGAKQLKAARDLKTLDERLDKTQEAITTLNGGLSKGATSHAAKLRIACDDAQIGYAETLLAKRYYSLARSSLKSLLDQKDRPGAEKNTDAEKKAKALVALISRQESDAESAITGLDSAKSTLAANDGDGALRSLRGVAPRLDVLAPEDQEKYRRLHVEALVKTFSAQSDLAIAENKWDLAEKELDTLEATLAARGTKDSAAALVGPLRKEVKRAHAEFRVTTAKRLQETDIIRALALVVAALPDLAEASAVAVDARTLKADLELRRAKPEDFERIPETVVQLGGDETNPSHPAEIRSFYLARHEVTNAEFARFVAAGGYAEKSYWNPAADPARFVDATNKPGPRGWSDGRPREGTDAQPVNGVSWFEADAYARWLARSKNLPYRLPTDDEWEAAARLASARPGEKSVLAFPWGAEWSTTGARLARIAEERRAPSPIRESAAHPEDRSACNCYDMAGNVSEWVAPADPAKADPAKASVRGGSFLLPYAEACAPAHRSTPRRTLRSEGVGFRIALDATRGGQ